MGDVMPVSGVIGLDIGGANLKVATAEGQCRSKSFAIWRAPERLVEELAGVMQELAPWSKIAVTMTAELADCFESKADGVRQVLESVRQVAGRVPVIVWQTSGRFVSLDEAMESPALTAAGNWHAQATFLGRQVPAGSALLIDTGSTTTDIIPFLNGQPVMRGLTDQDRLTCGELVYSGIRRTPLCALAPSVPVRGVAQRIAAELFSTTFDLHLLLGNIEESETDLETADGRPATIRAAHNRIAHQLCRDRTELTLDEAVEVARWLSAVQRRQICLAIDQVLRSLPQACESLLISGSGCFLIEQIADGHPFLRGLRRIRIGELLSDAVSEAACAFAVACLATESCQRAE